jgi:hypothetical protein
MASLGDGGPLVKGKMIRIVANAVVDEFSFQYNPSTYTESLGVNWATSKSPGQYQPAASFASFTDNALTFQIFMTSRGVISEADSKNTGWNGPILQQIERLKMFQSPSSSYDDGTAIQFVSPGICKLVLGSRSWSGVIRAMSFEYRAFSRDLDPISAVCDIDFLVTSQGISSEIDFLMGIKTRAGLS